MEPESKRPLRPLSGNVPLSRSLPGASILDNKQPPLASSGSVDHEKAIASSQGLNLLQQRRGGKDRGSVVSL